MLEKLLITVFPVFFLFILFGGGELFRRKKIDMDGEIPINKYLFIISKYAILLIWFLTVLSSWEIVCYFINPINILQKIALGLWIIGFIILIYGRFGLGNSFRIGSPKEATLLKKEGLYKFSRNPMYLGVYTTITSSVIYTLNPIFLFIVIFIIIVHHKIVLAEEKFLTSTFGQDYIDYCSKVRRYI